MAWFRYWHMRKIIEGSGFATLISFFTILYNSLKRVTINISWDKVDHTDESGSFNACQCFR